MPILDFNFSNRAAREIIKHTNANILITSLEKLSIEDLTNDPELLHHFVDLYLYRLDSKHSIIYRINGEAICILNAGYTQYIYKIITRQIN
jgi:Txe/YoeB family toxin of Txe-Axe toxin-antitoxin module